jgi:hypothetical protein
MVVWVAALLLALSALACASGGPFMPSHGVVTENKKAGPNTDRRHVCVKPDDGSGAVCESFSRSSVKNCTVGARWPDCREKS